MSTLSSKLDDVLNLGAGLNFGLAVAPNISGFAYLSVYLCVVCLRCVMYLSCLSTVSDKWSTFTKCEVRAGVAVPRDTLACRRIKPCARVLVACIRYAF